ncbi:MULTISPECIES: preprotein translocase subunit SecE [Basfia]|uniref:Protein translocase subunit SecE n=2 Tax=Basfia TaxID=697331 RepID=Q65W49_MANSM|nr:MULTISPECIES: preprotein translocase subunit SecE [Basfia]AAU36811.1 SecE protein [[Mannheimia] succiniciproducens MBEL55E]QIM69610.1 preprotein translocase subunit SecE [Basfia succiniciproducens]SCX83468.1 protein translocase subunit secE/sec61 gamma [Basfia succiniciproducens]SEQ08301.1 protein translocase subunit secE/sec61 gamma [Basfia succiniciproducens]
MALAIDKKKKNAPEEVEQKSKGLNTFLWVLVAVVIAVAAFGNVYYAEQFSTAVRVVAVVVLLAVALGIAAVTNQGKVALAFFGESRTELRRIVWPTRPEAMQTTLIVIGVTVLTSLILWGFDSIIVSIINFLTDLRF